MTDTIASVMSLIGGNTDKADYWKNSNQKQRWVSTSLLFIEGHQNKVNGYKSLSGLNDVCNLKKRSSSPHPE